MRSTHHRSLLVSLVLGGWLAASLGAQQRPARDAAGAQPEPTGTAVISGWVVAADTGRPIKRARLTIAGEEVSERLISASQAELAELVQERMQQGAGVRPGQPLRGPRLFRVATSDEQGRFIVRELPAGRYTITASKAGYVNVIFGQRRPLQPGTPLQVGDGQQIQNVNFVLPRGNVITGRLLDEDGEPLAGASVHVLRFQYVGGERRLVPAGSDQTDDRGQYRIYGLSPGDYFVSGVARGFGRMMRPGMPLLRGLLDEEAEEAVGYAPTYYPGVGTLAEAARVSAGLGQELTSIDFQLQLVPLARLSGAIVASDGTPLTGGVVILAPDEGPALARASNFTGRAGPDGTFTIDNVPPGRYTLYARTRPGRGEDPLYAVHTVVIAGQDLSNIFLPLSPGGTVSGYLTFEPGATPAPTGFSTLRIALVSLDPLPVGGRNQASRMNDDGTFVISGVPPVGRWAIRVQNPPAPWTIKAAYLDGRDVIDAPFELRAAQSVTELNVVLSDRTTELSGTVEGPDDSLPFGFTVIAFSTDPQHWHPQSRWIQAVQPDQTGAYVVRGLPAGSYYLAAVDDVEQGEWYDREYLEQARTGARRVTLTEGNTTAQDLTIERR